MASGYLTLQVGDHPSLAARGRGTSRHRGGLGRVRAPFLQQPLQESTLCGKQRGSDLGQLALRRPRSAPNRAPGCSELRPASANQPLGPHYCWPAISASLSFDVGTTTTSSASPCCSLPRSRTCYSGPRRAPPQVRSRADGRGLLVWRVELVLARPHQGCGWQIARSWRTGEYVKLCCVRPYSRVNAKS